MQELQYASRCNIIEVACNLTHIDLGSDEAYTIMGVVGGLGYEFNMVI